MCANQFLALLSCVTLLCHPCYENISFPSRPRVSVCVCVCTYEVGYLFHSTSHPYNVTWRFNAFIAIYFVLIENSVSKNISRTVQNIKIK